VVNTSSVQLLPTTMIALRAQAGAANPADIVLPTLLATAASTLCGIAACRAFARCGA
jgi:spore maturation protein A